MNAHSTFSFEEDKLDEVMGAISAGRMAKLSKPEAQLMLVSRKPQPGNIKTLIRKLQYLIRAQYGTRAMVVGGGYGCFRYILFIVGDTHDDVRKTISGVKGRNPSIVAALNEAKIDFIVDQNTQDRVNIETPSPLQSEAQKIQEILKTVPPLRQDLRQKFSGMADQARNLKDFVACLDEVLAALTKPVLGDLSATKKLKHLGDLLSNAKPEAYSIVEKLIGCVEFIAVIRLSQG